MLKRTTHVFLLFISPTNSLLSKTEMVMRAHHENGHVHHRASEACKPLQQQQQQQDNLLSKPMISWLDGLATHSMMQSGIEKLKLAIIGFRVLGSGRWF